MQMAEKVLGRGHGGLKKAVHDTHDALPGYQYVLRSDVKSYYESIRFDVLREIIESYIQHPALLKLVYNACRRTETRGGIFYDYDKKGIPKGSPLSPLLGAVALIPLDKAMEKIKGVFYARFMDDWVVLTKSKTALRKVIKITHEIMNALKFQLHPTKTYIGQIRHGFNFLAYYMDHEKILPSIETIRRFFERATVLYEHPQTDKNRSRRRVSPTRDISEYPANEAAPTDAYFQHILTHLLEAAHSRGSLVVLRRYLGQWKRWLNSGLSTMTAFARSVQTHLPAISSCWIAGPTVRRTAGCC